MYLFADTTYYDFYLVLFDQNFQKISVIIEPKIKQKVELLISAFQKILETQNLKINDLKGLFCSKGPGYFTGIRATLVFFQTLSYLNKIPLFTTDSFTFFKNQNKLIDARGNFAYQKKSGQLSLVAKPQNYCFQNYDYQFLINNFHELKNQFKEEKNALDVEPYYLKKPNIGVPKWKS